MDPVLFAGVTNAGVVYGSANAWENGTTTHVSYRGAAASALTGNVGRVG